MNLDGNLDIDKLNFSSYYCINSNHPPNRKRGGVFTINLAGSE